MSKNMTNGFVYEPKDSVEEPFYTVAEAMRLTGRSSTKFRYEPNKRELDSRGADLSQRVWRIPRRALVEMGWLSPDAPMSAEIVQGEKAPVRSSVQRIHELSEETKKLEASLAHKERLLAESQASLIKLGDLLAAANATIEARNTEIANLMSQLKNR